MFEDRLRSLAGLQSKPVEEKETKESTKKEESGIDTQSICKDLQKCVRSLKKKCSQCKTDRLKNIYKKDMEDCSDICELLKDGRANKACEIWNEMDVDSKENIRKICGSSVHNYFEKQDKTEPSKESIDVKDEVVAEEQIPNEIKTVEEAQEVEIYQVDFDPELESSEPASPEIDVPKDVMKDLENAIKDIDLKCEHFEKVNHEEFEYYKKVCKILTKIHEHLKKGDERNYSEAVTFVHGLLNDTYHRFIPFSVKRYLSFYPIGKSLKQFMDEKRDND